MGEGAKMRSQYKTGMKSRELILMRIKAHGRPADVATLSTLTGLKKNHINYTVGVMCALGQLHIHHYERSAQGNQKALYWTEKNSGAARRVVRLMS